jgi:hypothetical protein
VTGRPAKGLRRSAAAAIVAALAALALPAAASAAAANHFALSVPATATPGSSFMVTVTARDSGNAIDTTYNNGAVPLSSSDPAATLPGTVAIASGTGTFTATLNTPGCRRFTANDGSISGSSPAIAVNGCDVIDAQNNVDLSAGDPTQTGRIALDGTPSQCGSTKVPTIGAATGDRHYDAYTYNNLTNGSLCITVDLDPGANCAAAGIFNVSYLGAYLPASPLTDYAGDPGGASPAGGTVASESFTVPAGAGFTNVVHALVPVPGAGSTCTGYFYSASSNKPFANSLPAAVGSAAVGDTLGFSTGQWVGTQSFSYQWRRCDAAGANCGDISGATNGSYAPADADVGSTLRIRVAATDGLGTSTADSPPTAVVTGPPPNTTAAGTGQTPVKKKKCKKHKKHHASAAKKKCKKKRR